MQKLVHRFTVLALVVSSTPAISHAMTPKVATALVTDVSATCGDVAESLVPKATAAWSYPDACTAEGDAATCREALVQGVVKALDVAIEAADPKAEIRSKVSLESLEPQDLLALQPIVGELDQAASQGAEAAREAAREAASEAFAQFDPAADNADAAAKSVATKAFEAASEKFETKCSAETLDILSQLSLLTFPAGAEEDHEEDLTKDTGFSPVVRCQWIGREKASDALDCKPGLRVGGQDPSTILVSGPGGTAGRIAWVRAITAEEGFKRKPVGELTCPGYGGEHNDKLACDTICFAGTDDGEACRSGTGVEQALIAVHVPRWFGTSWGCGTRFKKACTFDRLRGPDDREKLSLIVRGKSPVILIQAEDAAGNLASGEVLVGYERWRFETGGFLAVTDVVDKKLVLKTLEEGDDVGKVKVVAIRDEDDLAQETGVFLNLIPRNYESLGLGLGFATHDSRAPAIYAGPVIRLRTFGHRGIASLSAGYALRQVERFPDLLALHPDLLSDESQIALDPNDASLQPELQWEEGWYVGIHLGFSFGPIGADDQEE